MKTKNKKTSHLHKKRAGLHQKRSPNFLKAYHPFIPILSFVLVFTALLGVQRYNDQQDRYSPSKVQTKPSVLAYATNISVNDLLSGTNQRRSQAGVGSLAINSKLQSAAQAKANDMANRNYWAHNTPEGNPPWVFINNAGYKYSKAGENLGCGFDDSSSLITGWYNSPTHKANLLDSAFEEVGFGIVNASNYNCGEYPASQQTIVVAMYGTPAAQSQPSTPSSTPSTNGTSSGSSAGGPTDTTATSNSSPAPAKNKKSYDSQDVVLTVLNPDGSPSPDTKVTIYSEPQTAITNEKGVVKFENMELGEHKVEVELVGAKSETTIELNGKNKTFELSIIKPELGSNTTDADRSDQSKPTSQNINRLSVLTERYAPWVLSALIVISVVGVIFVLVKHSVAAHKFLVKGEQYILNHKLIDIAVILMLISLFYLTRSVGVIL